MSDRLKNVEKLVLKNVAVRSVVDEEWCQGLAQLIRSLPKLNYFQLWGVTFEDMQGWNAVVDALKDNLTLEEVNLYRLRTVDRLHHDFSSEAGKHPVFVEKRAVAEYLKAKYNLSQYNLSQQLEASLHVRSNGRCQLSKARKQSKLCDSPVTLATVSDSADFCFQFLRHEADPSLWSNQTQVAPRAA